MFSRANVVSLMRLSDSSGDSLTVRLGLTNLLVLRMTANEFSTLIASNFRRGRLSTSAYSVKNGFGDDH